ncbi:MAG: hypothetical protein KGM18_04185 [Sphingomonadales bacterium]|nr:hypothetical protein [Sphingomonadales bacterium]
MTYRRSMQCACGAVECAITAPPIGTAVCYCADCQAAARMIEAEGHGPAVADADGGTALALIRNDRFALLKGEEHMTAHKLRPDSPTSRLVAGCCNSAMFIAFDDWRFWKSTMIERWTGDKPAIEMRLEVRDRTSDLPFPDDVPRYPTFPKTFLIRILRQWVAFKLAH